MKRKVENWSVDKLFGERPRISFPEYQREKRLWSIERKSLLIDSILRDMDIPKLYFNRLKDGNIEVIDGQQRLWTVWDFLDDGYPYIEGGKSQRFSKMTRMQKQNIRNYKFQATVFEDARDDYLRVLFVRLQLGLLLNTGEKLHAATGRMKRLVFGKLARHPFIEQIGIPMRRYAKPTLCAQICINSFYRKKLGSFARTRYDDLEHLFSEYADPSGMDLVLFDEERTKIYRVLDQLQECFGDNAKDLRNRSYILSIYFFVEELMDKEGELSERTQKTVSSFVFHLWKRLREEAKLGIGRENKQLYSFQTSLSSAPGEVYQIGGRHDKLIEFYNHFKRTAKIKGDR